jgi:hypothetical protein
MRVKIYEMGIDIIQGGSPWHQTEWSGESAAERFNIAPG